MKLKKLIIYIRKLISKIMRKSSAKNVNAINKNNNSNNNIPTIPKEKEKKRK